MDQQTEQPSVDELLDRLIRARKATQKMISQLVRRQLNAAQHSRLQQVINHLMIL